MIPERHRLAGPGKLLPWVEDHGVRNDHDGACPFDKMAQDDYCDEFFANRTGTTRQPIIVSEPELRLPDVPLIVEDLLAQARQLAGTGPAIELIEEALERVAALREGRG